MKATYISSKHRVIPCDPLDRYRATVVPQPHVSVAESLLAFWDKHWSPTALRFAYHALARAQRAGLDVLEYGAP